MIKYNYVSLPWNELVKAVDHTKLHSEHDTLNVQTIHVDVNNNCKGIINCVLVQYGQQ